MDEWMNLCTFERIFSFAASLTYLVRLSRPSFSLHPSSSNFRHDSQQEEEEEEDGGS
jgi:hypothetical protein